MNRVLLLLLLCGLAMLALPARAATTCTLSSPTLAFGTVSNGLVDTSTTFSVTCTTGAVALLANARVTFCLGLPAGTGGTGIAPWRTLANSFGDRLNYQVYSDPSRTIAIGSGAATSPAWVSWQMQYPVPLLGGSGTASFTLYGRYPANQVLSAGAFTSALAATFQYAYNEPLLGTPNYPATCLLQPPAATGNSNLQAAAMTLTATATVNPACGAYVTAPMDFGVNTGTVATNIDRTAVFSLTCVNRSPFQIGLDNGTHADAAGNRRMRVGSSGALLPYELYRDPARTQRWGNVLNTSTASGTGTGAAQNLTIYGRVPPAPGTATPPGSYSDTITVTITY
ncbi:spore coat U domain-containing protein [uncultured Stenotrophomonas sp.]|uniref:Csu type fimbrial protein n=1 Tax=uncultured Stenotrophomonas sp. TaxID=165438 RepID=UPI0025F1C38F|nr:spore coat U domain-containing protein [uncultured Stenotrophomonas sp.]